MISLRDLFAALLFLAISFCFNQRPAVDQKPSFNREVLDFDYSDDEVPPAKIAKQSHSMYVICCILLYLILLLSDPGQAHPLSMLS